MQEATLTLEAAKAYVLAYHAQCEDAAEVEGCGLLEGDTVVRLNVVGTDPQGVRFCCQWDVWIEPGVGLYGEC